MGRQIFQLILNILKSSWAWGLLLGAISDIGYHYWSTNTDPMIVRFGTVLADILQVLIRWL